MGKQLRIDAEAEEELRAAVAWYEKQQRGLGRDLYAAAREALDRVRDAPQRAGVVPGLSRSSPVRRVLMRRFPYAVVFVELSAEIRVLAFAHGTRRPGYWQVR